MKHRSFALLLALLPAALFAGQPSGGSTTPANAIPGGSQSATFVISKPGYYYLAGDRTMTDSTKNGIEIASSDVTLDLSGYTLRFANVSGTAMAVHGSNLQNVEIRNGAITDVPIYGIYLDASNTGINANLRIIDVRVSATGNSGIWVEGDSVLVDRCTVDHSGYNGIHLYWGNGMIVSNSVVSTTQSNGVLAIGNGAVVKNCTVSKAQGSGVMVYDGTVSDSHVTDCNLGKSTGGAGIFLVDASGVVRNCVVRSCFFSGIRASYGENLVEGNVIAATVTAANTPGVAIYADQSANVLAMNNRYTTGSTFFGNVANIGNAAF